MHRVAYQRRVTWRVPVKKVIFRVKISYALIFWRSETFLIRSVSAANRNLSTILKFIWKVSPSNTKNFRDRIKKAQGQEKCVILPRYWFQFSIKEDNKLLDSSRFGWKIDFIWKTIFFKSYQLVTCYRGSLLKPDSNCFDFRFALRCLMIYLLGIWSWNVIPT